MKFCPECGNRINTNRCYSCGADLSRFFNASNNDFSVLRYFDFTTDSLGKITLTKIKSDFNVKDLVIPDSVVAIGDYCFSNCSCLKTVKLPKNLTVLSNNAFYYCKNLESVEFNSALTEIKASAFAYCSSLDDVVLPIRLAQIGPYAFEYCTNLSSIKLPASVQTVGQSAFDHCENLSFVDVENVLAYCNIDFYNPTACPVFYARDLSENEKDITSITFENVITIRPFIFAGVDTIKSLTFTASNCSVSPYAFFGCTSIERISVKSGGTPVYQAKNNTLMRGNDVILVCPNSIVPSTATKLCEGAYCPCSEMEEIKVNYLISTIEEGALFGCSDVEILNVPTLPTNTKNGLYSLFAPKKFHNLLQSDEWFPQFLSKVEISNNTPFYEGAFAFFDELDEVVISGSETTFGPKAFNQAKIDTLIFGNVTAIAVDAFYGCDIKNVQCKHSDFKYSVEKNNIVYTTFYDGAKEKHLIYAGTENPSFPENVTHVLPFSITNDVITWITFPDSVKVISENAIHCPALKRATFGKGLTCLWANSFAKNCSSATVTFTKKADWIFTDAKGKQCVLTVDAISIDFYEIFAFTGSNFPVAKPNQPYVSSSVKMRRN